MGFVSWLGGGRTVDLKIGDAAPGFELSDQNGATHRLECYRGRWLVLYFYPRDDTPGCTREACEFRDDLPALRDLQATLLGVSTDAPASHRKFAAKYRLSFPLLSDPHGRVVAAYGSLFTLGPLRFARRHSFIIDPAGKLAEIYRHVDPATHSMRVRDDLRALLGADAGDGGNPLGQER